MDLFSVQVGGHEVAYGAAGTTANPPVVLVHGWAASHRIWRRTVPALQLRRRCIAPDLPGFGDSAKPRLEYTLQEYTGFLGRFLDALGIGACDVVGHSMGGAVSLLFALENPARVNRLCVVDPPLRGKDAFFPFTRFAMLPGIRPIMYLLCRMRWGRRWISKDFTYETRLEDDIVDDLARGTYRSMMRTVFSMMDLDLAPRLRDLAMPVLLVGTDKDRVIRPEQQALLPEAPNLRAVTISPCGHIPMMEHPEEFNRTLTGFLDLVEAPCSRA